MKHFRAFLLLMALPLMVVLSGCVVPGYPAYAAPGTPAVVLPPIVIPGWGYGYRYGGGYWGYRRGYCFYNGHYYRGGGWHGGYGGYRGYGGGWHRY